MLNEKIREMLSIENERYGKAQLIDYFKVLFQACYGPGHGINNVNAAREYYLKEYEHAESLNTNCGIVIQDLSYPNSFYRVYFSAVDQGYIGKEELFEGFRSSSKIKCNNCNFLKLWKETEQFVTEELKVEKDIESAESIDRFFNESIFPSHSDLYRTLYTPHYRLIHKKYLSTDLLNIL